jgi:hypothetical protein
MCRAVLPSDLPGAGDGVIATIHQPSYLPWAPFLEKGLRSEVYVLLDAAEFEKNSEQNRNRVKTASGAAWLTVPVSRRLHTQIADVRIAGNRQGWSRKHRQTIEQNYHKARFFETFAPRLFELLDRDWDGLLELNLAIDELFLELAGFQGRIVRASEMDVQGTSWRCVLGICQALGATTYLSGIRGYDYLELSAFAEAGIDVVFQRYEHRPYPQLFPTLGFVPRLSALDLFANVGTGDAARDCMLSNSRWATAGEVQRERRQEGPATSAIDAITAEAGVSSAGIPARPSESVT